MSQAERAMSAQRIALVEAIDAEWAKHAQPINVSVPTGPGAHRNVRAGEAMGRIGFQLAVVAIIKQLTGEELL